MIKSIYALYKMKAKTDELSAEREAKEISKAADIEFSVVKNLIAAYRELVEGGKPQFFFVTNVNRTHDEITEEKVLFWIPVNELKGLAISADMLIRWLDEVV